MPKIIDCVLIAVYLLHWRTGVFYQRRLDLLKVVSEPKMQDSKLLVWVLNK